MSLLIILDQDPYSTTELQKGFATAKAPAILPEIVRDIIENAMSTSIIKSFESSKTISFAVCLKEVKTKLRRAIKKAIYLYHATSTGLRSLVPQYQSEVFDTKHRYGKQLEPFFKVWTESTTTDDFNAWMEKLDSGADVLGKDALELQKLITEDGTPIAIPKVEYVHPKKLPEYELQVGADGKIFTKQSPSQVFHSPDQKKESAFGFVISAEKKLYVAPYKRGTFNHSSFLAGRPVLCAGVFFCDQGKVTTLWDDSGHYNIGHYHITERPDSSSKQHMLTALNTFKDNGVDITGVTLMINEVNNGKWNIATLTATDFVCEMSQLSQIAASPASA